MATDFETIWTKTAVEQIRKDFVYGGRHLSFLCLASSLFSTLWDDPYYRREIAKLARNFIPERPDIVWNENQEECLFYVHPANDYQIRLDFLDHEIKRLSVK